MDERQGGVRYVDAATWERIEPAGEAELLAAADPEHFEALGATPV
jgi:hypothetical protein